MFEITCNCGKSKRSFLHLSAKDFPDGLSLPCCKEQKIKDLEAELKREEKKAEKTEKVEKAAPSKPAGKSKKSPKK